MSEPADATLLAWLAARYPTAKRQTLRRMLQAGRVRINGRLVWNAKQPVEAGDDVTVADPVVPQAARPASLRVVYEDDDVVVVDKPAGLLTSTVPREPRPTLLAEVRGHLKGRIGLIHRLDRDASGLLVFSKTHEAYRSLKQQFFDHSVERVYTAVVEGIPTPRAGRIESRLVERADGTVYSARRPGEGEKAVTHYETVDTRGGRSLLRVTLHTGRKHQIRVHLSERGTPIVGDKMYAKPAGGGLKKGEAAPRLMLAATRLSFTHPRTGRPLTFELPVPKAFAAAFAPEPVKPEPITGKKTHR